MKFGLGSKIVLAIELVVFVVALSCALVALNIQRNALENLTKRQLESVSILKEYSIKEHINQVMEKLEFISTNKRTQEIFADFLQYKDISKKKETLLILEELSEERDIFSEIFILDTNGVIVVSIDTLEEGKIRSNENFFLNGKTKPTIHNFYYNISSEKPELIITVPIKDEKEIFLGILASKIKLEEISNLILEKSGLEKTGESFLVNSFSQVVTDLKKEPDAALKKTLRYLPQIKDCLNGSSTFSLSLDYHGDEVFGYWRWLPEIKSCLVTKIDSREALAPMNKISLSMFWIIGIIGLGVGIVGYIFGQSIVIPLRNLRDFSIKVKGGNFKIRASINSKDEIGDISVVFNEMVEHLSKYTATLESEVEKRTIELNEKINEGVKSKSAIINLLEDIEEEKKKVEGVVVRRTKELTAEKARLLSSLNSLSLGFIIADLKHCIFVKNKAVSNITGVPFDEISIDKMDDLFKDKINLKEVISQCVGGDYNKNICEIRETLLGSKSLRIMVVPVSLSDDSKETVGYVLVIEDITEAKVMERSRDEFFSIASHELRTPLTAIRGNTEMIQDFYKDKIKDKDISEMIGDIHEASVRLINIVNDFLKVSSLEQNKLKFDGKVFDVGEIITSVIDDIKGLAEKKSLGLVFEKPTEKLPPVLADIDHTKEVVINFVANAINYTKTGSVIIAVEKAPDFLKILIKDTGVGISPENQALLFRKFQQAGDILARDNTKSTGLGLYISKLLVETMGGNVALEKSALGEGSTFSFTLPIAP